jgi:hypothetical protein
VEPSLKPTDLGGAENLSLWKYNVKIQMPNLPLGVGLILNHFNSPNYFLKMQFNYCPSIPCYIIQLSVFQEVS